MIWKLFMSYSEIFEIFLVRQDLKSRLNLALFNPIVEKNPCDLSTMHQTFHQQNKLFPATQIIIHKKDILHVSILKCVKIRQDKVLFDCFFFFRKCMFMIYCMISFFFILQMETLYEVQLLLASVRIMKKQILSTYFCWVPFLFLFFF